MHASGVKQTTDLGGLQLPGEASHHIHSVSSSHAHSAHAQAAGVGGVGVRANHHATREGVVLQHNLRSLTSLSPVSPS